MKAFNFDSKIVQSYEQFTRSFADIRADDLRETIGKAYDSGRFWPSPLLSLNPQYLNSLTIEKFVNEEILTKETGQIFRLDNGQTVTLYRHQAEAISKAKNGESFIVTSGTGSGKSLCFFIPIVDKIIRDIKVGGKERTTKAIIIYPMNALANSQVKEINKFIEQSGLPPVYRPKVRRFTGQESRREREDIAKNPADILLTNYMMAELLLTRQNSIDVQVMENAKGLEFIVLDEFHTYRGRQGADVAILVRRLRERCCQEQDIKPLCIGTSATMIPEKTEQNANDAIAKVAKRLFGSKFTGNSIINESLNRATNENLNLDWAIANLKAVLEKPLPKNLNQSELLSHPLAVWVELAIGLDDGQHRERRPPVPFETVTQKLNQDSGVAIDTCRVRLEEFLSKVSLPENQRGGDSDESFLPFKLHRFLSNAGDVYTTLSKSNRSVYFDGQREVPGSDGVRLYTTKFCGNCGQEYHLVTKLSFEGKARFVSRSADDSPIEEDAPEVAGYLCPVPDCTTDFAFNGTIESYPETWVREYKGSLKIASHRRKMEPAKVNVGYDGKENTSGKEFWFIPGKFCFCLCCRKEPHPNTYERNRLVGISGGGRSSSTTHLVASALKWMEGPENGVSEKSSRKILGFSDNRQDAALQSGHFNDFLFVSLLRGGILQAIEKAGEAGLSEGEFGHSVAKALGFTAINRDTQKYWMQNPKGGLSVQSEAERTLVKVLSFRVWNDLRREWRYTNPNLSVLKLIELDFLGLEQVVSNTKDMSVVLPEFAEMDHNARANVVKILFTAMVEDQAINTESLNLTDLDTIGRQSRNLLRWPWAIDHEEKLKGQTFMVPHPLKGKQKLNDDQMILRAGYQSRIAKQINRNEVLGRKLNKQEYNKFIERLIDFLKEDYLVSRKIGEEDTGWSLNPFAVRLVKGKAVQSESKDGHEKYSYFRELYKSISNDLVEGKSTLWGLEGREHTAQVTQWQREWREWRFRFGDDDKEKMKDYEYRGEIDSTGESDGFLPALFCSPTMELGIDISTLNTVYLRNVPPTPANYVQRAGRAGRSGQAANVLTYCAPLSPHDQYYFERREEMVAGAVRLPTLDTTNEELVISHLNAVWLAETGLALDAEIPKNLILDGGG